MCSRAGGRERQEPGGLEPLGPRSGPHPFSYVMCYLDHVSQHLYASSSFYPFLQKNKLRFVTKALFILQLKKFTCKEQE